MSSQKSNTMPSLVPVDEGDLFGLAGDDEDQQFIAGGCAPPVDRCKPKKPKCPPKEEEPKCKPKPKCAPPKPKCEPKPKCPPPKPKCPPKLKPVPCDPCADASKPIDPTALGESDAESSGAAGKKKTKCGSPLYSRVLTLVGDGIVCDQNEIFNWRNSRAFQEKVMGRSAIEAAENAADAERYFAQEFGLDFGAVEFDDGVKKIDGAAMFGWQLTTKAKLRVYSLSDLHPGQEQPRGAIKVWMGGWAVRINSNDFRLGGRFGENEGKCLRFSEGTLILYGDYKLQAFVEEQTKECYKDPCDPCGKEKVRIKTDILRVGKPLIVKFRSRAPVVGNNNQTLVIDSQLKGKELGRSMGTISMSSVGSGADSKLKVSLREVWTFPEES